MDFLLFHLPYFHYFSLKLIPFAECFVADTCPVIINSGHRVAEELGDLGTIRNPQTDQGKEYASSVFSSSPCLGCIGSTSNALNSSHKVGEELQEGHIEVCVELFQLFFEELGRFNSFIQLLYPAGSRNLIQGTTV